jgi:hypothetical protein
MIEIANERSREQEVKHLLEIGERMLRGNHNDGLEYAGAGYFSKVYTHGEYALKLGGIKDENDSGHLYTAWCMDNQDLELVPEIYAMKEQEDGTYLVVMQRLYFPHHLTEFGFDDGAIDDIIARSRTSACLIERADEETAEMQERGEYDEDEVSCVPGTAEFIQGFADIRDAGGLDLHDENYMFTKEGNMKITDPMSWKK